jgi:hypothetical protein
MQETKSSRGWYLDLTYHLTPVAANVLQTVTTVLYVWSYQV